MKLGILTSNYPPEILAGTERVVVALARELRARDVELFVLTTSEAVHTGEDIRVEQYDDVPVRRVFKKLDEWDQHGLVRPRLVGIVGDVLQQERPDLLHAHSLAGWGTGQLQQARQLGIPTVLTFHDVWATCPRYFRLPPEGHGISCPEGAGREPCVACVNLALRHPEPEMVRRALASRDHDIRLEVAAASVCTAPSRTTAQMIRDHLPLGRRVEVIGHGALREVAAGDKAAPPAGGEPLRVGTFGNLVEQKGVLELVEACAGLDAELHCYGGFIVPEFEVVVRRRARELGVTLSCHGRFDPRREHPARHLHLAVFPSKCQESYGLVVDEALQHGVPVVVSDRGALAERQGTGGVVVTPLAGLAAVLGELCSDRARLAALRAAIPAALPTIGTAAERYLALYRAALAPQR